MHMSGWISVFMMLITIFSLGLAGKSATRVSNMLWTSWFGSFSRNCNRSTPQRCIRNGWMSLKSCAMLTANSPNKHKSLEDMPRDLALSKVIYPQWTVEGNCSRWSFTSDPSICGIAQFANHGANGPNTMNLSLWNCIKPFFKVVKIICGKWH